MRKDFFDLHIEIMGSDKKLNNAIKNKIKKMIPNKIATTEKKMKTFVNDIGCKMCFEESIPEAEVNKRLSWMGKNWRELK